MLFRGPTAKGIGRLARNAMDDKKSHFIDKIFDHLLSRSNKFPGQAGDLVRSIRLSLPAGRRGHCL